MTDFDKAAKAAYTTYVEAAWDSLATRDITDHITNAVLGSLDLEVEVVWAAGDSEDAWNNVTASSGGDLYLHGHVEPATDEELRAQGLVKKRRLVSSWEEI